tara:strand:- start:1217 stop:1546 length:330 start_codon:yes stop_codon:yes gene_type:complete
LVIVVIVVVVVVVRALLPALRPARWRCRTRHRLLLPRLGRSPDLKFVKLLNLLDLAVGDRTSPSQRLRSQRLQRLWAPEPWDDARFLEPEGLGVALEEDLHVLAAHLGR